MRLQCSKSSDVCRYDQSKNKTKILGYIIQGCDPKEKRSSTILYKSKRYGLIVNVETESQEIRTEIVRSKVNHLSTP